MTAYVGKLTYIRVYDQAEAGSYRLQLRQGQP